MGQLAAPVARAIKASTMTGVAARSSLIKLYGEEGYRGILKAAEDAAQTGGKGIESFINNLKGLPKETQTAIKKLTPMWEKNHGIMVNLFEQLSQSEFTLTKDEKYLKTETGDVATAKVTIQGKEIPYRLYKMKNGLWGFRM